MSFKLNNEHIKQRFNRAAKTYDEYAEISKTIGHRLIERLDLIKLDPERILDLGAGTGYFSKQLKKRYPKAQVIALDKACAMLAKIQDDEITTHCAPAAVLPLPDRSVDFVFSNLLLPWCNDLSLVFSEVQRVLKPQGLFLFSTLGPDSFHELRQAWRAVDDQAHVHVFFDMHDVGDALLKSGLADPVMDVSTLQFVYPNVPALLRELKAIGFTNALANRQKGLMGRKCWQQFLSAYPTQSDKASLSLEVVYGHAWGATVHGKQGNSPDEYVVPLEELRKQLSR